MSRNPSPQDPDVARQREQRRHTAAIAALALVVVGALGVFSSMRQVEDALAYLFQHRLLATLFVLGAIAAMVGTGFVRLGRASTTGGAGQVWIGRLLIWIPLLTPLLIGLVWWVFFSRGDD